MARIAAGSAGDEGSFMVRTNARRKLKQRKRPKQADQGAEAVLALKVSRCRCVNCTDAEVDLRLGHRAAASDRGERNA